MGSFSLKLLPRSPRDASPRSPSPHLAVAVLGQVFHQDFPAVAQLPAHPLQPRGDLLRVQRGGRRAPGVVARLGGGVRPARPRLRLRSRRAAQARAPLAAGSRCRRRHLPGRPAAAGSSEARGEGREREPEEARAGARRAEAVERVGGGEGGGAAASSRRAGRGNLSAEEEPRTTSREPPPRAPGPRAPARRPRPRGPLRRHPDTCAGAGGPARRPPCKALAKAQVWALGMRPFGTGFPGGTRAPGVGPRAASPRDTAAVPKLPSKLPRWGGSGAADANSASPNPGRPLPAPDGDPSSLRKMCSSGREV